MEPQSSKKLTVGIVAVLIGLAVGAYGGWVGGLYYIRSNYQKICVSSFGQQRPVSYTVSQDAIKQLTALEPGKTLSGKVSKKDASGITLDVWIYNTLNPSANQSVPTQIPYNSSVDKVYRLGYDKTSGITKTAVSFDDIKTGDNASVLILQDHKEFQLPPAK